MVRHDTYPQTLSAPEGDRRAVVAERLGPTVDEIARGKIKRGPGATRHFDILQDHLKALARAGEIRDVDFPMVRAMRADGTTVDGLETDDAFMSGERPEWLKPNEPTEFEFARWMVRKVEQWIQDGFYDQTSPEYMEFMREFTRISGELESASSEVYDDIKWNLRRSSSDEDDFGRKYVEYSDGGNQLMNEYKAEILNPVGESATGELKRVFLGS